MTDSFTIHRSYVNAMRLLKKADQFAFLSMIIDYALDGIEPDQNSQFLPMFAVIRPNIDESNRKRKTLVDSRKKAPTIENQESSTHDHAHDHAQTYEPRSRIGRGIGIGSRIGRGLEGETPLTPTSQPVSELPLDDNKTLETGSKKFKKPTAEEVAEYCREKEISIDPEYFCDWYEARGWKTGRDTMKDWKATVRFWARGNAHGGGRGQVNGGEAAAVVPWDPSKRTLRELRPADAD
jgi:hypothetical protein